MPQNGLHGLIGLWVARAIAPRVPTGVQAPLVLGTVIGSMAPDVDMYPTAVAFLVESKDAVYDYHRTATHSVLLVTLLALIGLLRSANSKWRWTCWGIALGVTTHIFLDLFFWFAQLDLMWPLSRIPQEAPPFQIINVWSSPHAGLASNLRDALEFAAFAWLLSTIQRISSFNQAGVNIPKHERWSLVALWILFGVTTVTAFIFSDPQNVAMQQIAVNAPYLLFALPYCWYRVWAHRHAIVAWSTNLEPHQAVSQGALR